MLEWLRAPRRRRRGHVVRLPRHERAQRARRRLRRSALRLRFVEEPEPRGTAGALKFAEELLDERFLMLNGDVLTDIDLTAQIAQHEATGAVGTLALVPVDDPTAYGLVRTHEDDARAASSSRSRRADQIDTNLISAGAYVLERERARPDPARAATSRSSARSGRGSSATASTRYAADAYWLDIGTPERYLQGDLRHPRGQRRAPP